MAAAIAHTSLYNSCTRKPESLSGEYNYITQRSMSELIGIAEVKSEQCSGAVGFHGQKNLVTAFPPKVASRPMNTLSPAYRLK